MTGKQHLVVSVLVTTLQTANVCLWDQALTSNNDATWFVVGTVIGWFVTPDMDVNTGTFLQQKSNLFSILWRILWWPYAKLIKHRSFFSHFPLVGTLLRAVYLFPLSYYVFTSIGPRNFFFLLAGVALQDFAHTFVDVVKL